MQLIAGVSFKFLIWFAYLVALISTFIYFLWA